MGRGEVGIETGAACAAKDARTGSDGYLLKEGIGSASATLFLDGWFGVKNSLKVPPLKCASSEKETKS